MTPMEQRITELWGHITAATQQFLELVGEFDAAGRWGGVGIKSCAHWLNIYCGIGIVAAREKVRVARELRELPKINAAFREGRVSYSKVRAMTRVATPENEDILLNIALHGTAEHVERMCRAFRRVERIEEAREAAVAHRERYLDFRHDDDGNMIVHGRLPVEVGELVRTAIERAMELAESGNDASAESSDGAKTDSAIDAHVELTVPEDRHPVGARRADALRVVAAQFLAAAADQTKSSSADRYQVVVHIDQRLLSGDDFDGGSSDTDRPAQSAIEDGPALAVDIARRLCCDGSQVGIVDDEYGEPLNVGRKTRAIPPAIKRALKARDKGCRFPGCPHTRFTEGHHIMHWANGGETRLSNLVTLCYFHHHLVHEGGFSVERTDDGVFVFRQPDCDRLREDFAVNRRFSGSVLPTVNRDRGVAIRPDSIVTRWTGESMDYSLAIDALLRSRHPPEPHRASFTAPERS